MLSRERDSQIALALYIVICFLLVGQLIFFQYGFWCYHLYPPAWEKQEVYILTQEVKDRSISNGSHYYIHKGEVVYQYQGIEYKTKVLISNYESIGDAINIAVCKNNGNLVIRCDFIEIESWSITLYFAIFIVLNILKWRKGKKRESVIGITTNNYQKTTDTLQEKEFKKCCFWQNVKLVLLIIGSILGLIRVYIEYFRL